MDQWEQLRQQCMSCRACGLADTRTNVVFGVGSPTAEVLLVGEAPGEREALEGVRDRWLRLVNGEDASVTENR